MPLPGKLETTPKAISVARTSVQRYTIRVAAERASDLVGTAEIDDADAPLQAQSLAHYLHAKATQTFQVERRGSTVVAARTAKRH